MLPLSSSKVVFLGDLAPFDLTCSTPKRQRTMIVELLYPLVEKLEPSFAPKITGMILVLDQDRVLHLLESPEALKETVKEAIEVLGEWIPQQLQQLQQLEQEAACKLLASMLSAKL